MRRPARDHGPPARFRPGPPGTNMWAAQSALDPSDGSGSRWTKPRSQWWPTGSPGEHGAAGEGGAHWPAGPSTKVTDQIVAVKTQSFLSEATMQDRARGRRGGVTEGSSEGRRAVWGGPAGAELL